MRPNLRSVVAQVGRSLGYRRLNFSSLPASSIEPVVGLLGRVISFSAGFGFAGPLLTGDYVSELEEKRQKELKEKFGDSAEIVDLRATMWSCFWGSVWADLSGNASRIFTGDKKN